MRVTSLVFSLCFRWRRCWPFTNWAHQHCATLRAAQLWTARVCSLAWRNSTRWSWRGRRCCDTARRRDEWGGSLRLNPDPVLSEELLSVMSVTLLQMQTREKTSVIKTRQTLPLKSVPDVHLGLIVGAVSYPWRRTEGDIFRSCWTEGKNQCNILWTLTHIEGYSILLHCLWNLVVPTPAGLSLVLVSLAKFLMLYFILLFFFFSCMMFTQNSCLGILSNTVIEQKKSLDVVQCLTTTAMCHHRNALRLLKPAVKV